MSVPLHLVPLSNLSCLAGLQIYVTGLHEKDFNVPKEKNEVQSKKSLASEASDSFSPLPPPPVPKPSSPYTICGCHWKHAYPLMAPFKLGHSPALFPEPFGSISLRS